MDAQELDAVRSRLAALQKKRELLSIEEIKEAMGKYSLMFFLSTLKDDANQTPKPTSAVLEKLIACINQTEHPAQSLGALIGHAKSASYLERKENLFRWFMNSLVSFFRSTPSSQKNSTSAPLALQSTQEQLLSLWNKNLSTEQQAIFLEQYIHRTIERSNRRGAYTTVLGTLAPDIDPELFEINPVLKKLCAKNAIALLDKTSGSEMPQLLDVLEKVLTPSELSRAIINSSVLGQDFTEDVFCKLLKHLGNLPDKDNKRIWLGENPDNPGNPHSIVQSALWVNHERRSNKNRGTRLSPFVQAALKTGRHEIFSTFIDYPSFDYRRKKSLLAHATGLTKGKV